VLGPVFHGEHELTIDDKNRMLIPSEVRKCLKPEHGDAFYLILNTINNMPWLYPVEYYNHLANQGERSLIPDADVAEYYRMVFAMANKLDLDKQGRVLIPTPTIKRSVLKDQKEVTLIGANDHLELWPRQAWEVEREAMMARAVEIRLRVKEFSKRSGGQTL